MKKLISVLLLFAAICGQWSLAHGQCTQSVPYTEGFESVWGTTYNTAGMLPDCWSGYSNGTDSSYFPHVVTGTGIYSYQHTGSGSLVMTSGSEVYGNTKVVLLPPMSAALNQLYLTFWMYTESSSKGTLTVGYVTGDDTTTFTPIQSYPATTTTYHSGNGLQPDNVGLEVELSLAEVPTEATRIAFRWDLETSYYTCCIDDVTLSYPPVCPRVTNLTTTPTVDGAIVSWEETGVSTQWLLTIMEADTVVSSSIYSTTSATLTGLVANTEYTIQVAALCYDSTTSLLRRKTFRTLCSPVATSELPWSYGFEDATGSGSLNTFNSCLGRHVVNSNTHYPYPTSSHIFDGNYALYMYSSHSSDIYSWLTLPPFEENLNALQLSFWVHGNNGGNYGHWAVGVMSNPDDFSTFDTIASGQAMDYMELVEVPLASYNGTGTILAILCPITSGYSYTYIDALMVDYLPSCIRPLGVTATDITATSATITINDPSASGNHLLVVNDYDSIIVTGTTYTLTGLEPVTTYYLRVSSICDSNTMSNAAQVAFTTPCATIITYPWMEDFNEVGSINDLTCWNRYSGLYNDTADFSLTESSSGWNLYHTHGMDGSQHMKTNIYGAAVKYWLMTPRFEVESGTELSFDYSLTAYTSDSPATIDERINDDRFIVFVVTGDDTFVPLAKWGSDSLRDNYPLASITHTTNSINFPLDQYTGQTVRFAFYVESTESGSDLDLHIDDIYVGESQTCPRPQSVWVSNITSDAAIVYWADPVATGNYAVEYYPSDSTSIPDTVIVSGTSVTLTGLMPNTTYTVNVMSNCGTLTLPRSTTFLTHCLPIDVLPWTEDFEASPTGSNSNRDFAPCLTRLNNASTYFGYPYVCDDTQDNHTSDGIKGLYWLNSTAASYGDYQYVVLPAVNTNLYAINTLQLRFWSRAYYSSETPTFQVGVMTNPDDASTFVPLKSVNVLGTTFERYTVPLENYSGSGAYVAIMAQRGTNTWRASVDDLTLEVRPACPEIVDLEAVTTAGGALLTWDILEGYDAPSNYEVTYNRIDTIGEPTVINVNTNQVVLSGLSDGISYIAYVQANCTGFELGPLDSVTFTTHHLGCAQYDAATADTITLNNSYDSYTANNIPIGNYWKYSYTQQLILSNEMHGSATLNSIAFEYINSEPSTVKNDVTIYLANVSDTSLEEGFIGFNATTFVPVYHGSLNCSLGWNKFAFEVPFAYDSNSNLLIVVHDNSGAYNGSNYRFATHPAYGRSRFVQTDSRAYDLNNISSNGNLADRANMMLYGADCQVAAVCAAPAVKVMETTENSVSLMWAAGNEETSWDVSYRPLYEEYWIPAATGITNNNYTCTGLQSETTYDFRVSFTCSDAIGGTYEGIASATTLTAVDTTLPAIDTHSVVYVTFDVTLNEGESFRGHTQAGYYTELIPSGTVDSIVVTRLSMVINHTVGQESVALNSNVSDGAWIGLDDVYSCTLPSGTVSVEPMTTHRYLFTHTATSETMIDNGDFERGYWDGEDLTPDYQYASAIYLADIPTNSYGYIPNYGKNGSYAMAINGFNDTSKTVYSATLPTLYGHTYQLTYSTNSNCLNCGVPLLDMYVDGERKFNGDMVFPGMWRTYTHTFVAKGNYTVVSLRWGLNNNMPSNITLDDISVVDLMSPEPSYDTITVINRHVLVYDTSHVHICNGDTYATDGQTFNENGTYTLSTQYATDTTRFPALVLTVHDNYYPQLETEICDGDSITVTGIYYSKSGIYVDSLLSFAGCDSIVTLNLTVHPTHFTIDTVSVCDSYLWHGTVYSTSAIVADTLDNIYHCDSICTLDLTVRYSTAGDTAATVCDALVWYDSLYTESGDYTHTLVNNMGCDSIATMYLTVNYSTSGIDSLTACDSLLWHDSLYTESGDYIHTLVNSVGCDSVTTLILTVNPTYQHSDSIFACDNQLPFLYHEQALDTAGLYSVTLQSVANCDSTLAVTLTVGATYHHSNDITICQSGMPFVYGDHTFVPEDPSGLYNVTFNTMEGCDSVIALDLTVHESEVPEIYVVTVEATNNLVVWEKNAVIDHYNIYRESSTAGLYSLVAEVPYSEPSMWLDEGSDARTRSYRYRMTAVDSCGVESEHGTIHKTMHLTINQGQGSSWNLVWTEYEGTTYSTYRIYRGTSYNNLQFIDEMPAGGNTTYTDNYAPSGNVYYQIVVLLNPQGTKGTKDGDGNMIRSNIATNDLTGIGSVAEGFLKIYQQNGDIKIETIEGLNIQVFDVSGRMLHDAVSTGNDSFSVPVTGAYLVRVEGMKARRVVVQKN